MKIEELRKKLKEIKQLGGDEEIDHMDADELLLAYINDKEVSETFDSIGKWYA